MRVPNDRTESDVEAITDRLRRIESFSRLPQQVLQQLAACGVYEDLEKGVTLFREGELGSCWYVVLSGTLAVKIQDTTDGQLSQLSVRNKKLKSPTVKANPVLTVTQSITKTLLKRV
ncbi:hypothetical protein RUM44_006754 [Polyplax serrata]|uniref:Cyclic nucleotide-binding domain-containing protein n=1 Tax=Polyplax serrata TaxID=468196 RepID=A0ABR1AJ02_POLSC